VLLAVVGLILLLIVIGALAGGEEAASDVANQEANASTVEPALEVTARELFNAYDANEVAAQQTYGGQRLKVTGTVQGVTLDFMDNPVVQLATSNEFLPVQALLDDANAAAAITKGSSISLVCEDLTEVIGAPQLGGCAIAP